ncbi:hypothetical protein K458DRAFT_424899 [Lentithecium fluviatile CBS 122367]|uniref:Uncharacterized protein n=1 Tax=Lentithecium fluviatile CBS 122367 TaxID=1168545 RepID=A0A6G1IDK0_9PLEO|nr:hypothetical protein K458DRAFT_424899 [Lentithecium fluviatile CBS 122367]
MPAAERRAQLALYDGRCALAGAVRASSRRAGTCAGRLCVQQQQQRRHWHLRL